MWATRSTSKQDHDDSTVVRVEGICISMQFYKYFYINIYNYINVCMLLAMYITCVMNLRFNRKQSYNDTSFSTNSNSTLKAAK